MKRWVIFFIVLVWVGGMLWPWIRELGLAHFPGDVIVNIQGTRLPLPLTTAFVITTVIAGVWRLLDRNN